MNVMLDEPGILTQSRPAGPMCEVWWGKRLAAVRVELARADAAALQELLEDAWEGKRK